MLAAKETISEIQDCAAFAFKEFHDLVCLVRLGADFLPALLESVLRKALK